MATEAVKRPAALDDFCGLALLDDIIRSSYGKVKTDFEASPKLGEWLKMIELRVKLSAEKATNRELWQLLEEVRRDVLNGKKSDAGKPTTLKRRSSRKSRTPKVKDDA
jgi:hypothetical protein